MMWGYYDGWSWLLMAVTMLLFWGGIAALVVYGIRSLAGGRSGDQAMDVLRRRLASGEITQDDYERTRRTLQGS
jgi:putative membrane protein